jgi:hypothetical protein
MQKSFSADAVFDLTRAERDEADLDGHVDADIERTDDAQGAVGVANVGESLHAR